MTALKRQLPKTPQEYYDLVKQAIFEVDEIRASIEYDLEGIETSLTKNIDDLKKALEQMKTSLEDGSYQFENKDLPFMPLVAKYDNRTLPFKPLLEDLNKAHQEGLAIDD